MASSAKQAVGFADKLRAFINSPTGPKTTHFWGPVANWGFVIAVR
jgi:mitochondrial pyruvate carrier 1